MKKMIALFTAALLALLMAAGTCAAGIPHDVDVKNFQAVLRANAANNLVLMDGDTVSGARLLSLKPGPGSELKIYLTDTMFTDNQGTRLNETDKPGFLSRSQVQEAKLTVRRSTSQGSGVFDSIGIRYDWQGAYLGVRFAKPFVSTEPLDFSATLTLHVDGKSRGETAILLSGTLRNAVTYVTASTDYVDLAEGRVVEAAEKVGQLEFDLGEGLRLRAALRKGHRYYAWSSTEVSVSDSRLMRDYPGIQGVYTLRTVNLHTATGFEAYIDTVDRMYVYDGGGRYLGHTDGALPFAAKYYVSSRKYDQIL